ncbi:MAG TPA: YbaB/EbfC family nucleoid-associated protein [Elusimicrobiales bacterium]|nr:YbaB/EbfC family nucleoid-associated protein [Elusimicrobiales bacterium]
MFDKMKELLEIKRKMDEVRKELDSMTLESEDNLVKVGISGSQNITRIVIKSDLGSADKSALESSLTETVNRAIKQSQKMAVEKMGALSGLALPKDMQSHA